MLNNMFACATTKHQGSYVTSLKVNSNTNISSIYKYIDIIKTLKNTLSFHSELIKSTSPWKIEKDLGFISFEDITCLDKIEYDVYGAWDEFGYIIFNDIKFRLKGVSNCWWSDHNSSVHTSPDKFFGNFVIDNEIVNNIIQNASNNQIHCIAGAMEPDNVMGKEIDPDWTDNGEYWGGADGSVIFTYTFRSKRK